MMSVKPVESLCLDQVYALLGNGTRSTDTEQVKKLFKTVNSMLQVLDKDGLYGTIVYLEAYGNADINLLGNFNLIVNEVLNLNLPDSVNNSNLSDVKEKYKNHFADDTSSSRAAEMILRRLLIHLRYAAKTAEQ